MEITENYKTNPEIFEERNIKIPCYSDQVMRSATEMNPEWVHFGGGNLYRCFHAGVAQELLNTSELTTGIVVVETFGQDMIEELYHNFNNRSLTVTMKTDGTFTQELIASTAEALFFNRMNPKDVHRLVTIFKNHSLKMVTLTITEKGYLVKKTTGELLPDVSQDIKVGPVFEQLENTMAKLVFLLYQRFLAGATPLAMVSTDNFSQNGDHLKAAIIEIAKGWAQMGHVPATFVSYLETEGKISFPYSMIDRITPLPNQEIAASLEAQGIEKMFSFVSKNQNLHLAAFVNTEEAHYLAIEDDFPNGRPALEKASGVFLGDKETIRKADLMKVCTCLNPLHTALAIFGVLLGFDRIYQEIQDNDLLHLIEQIGFIEGIPVVENPRIIEPKTFINEVIYQRFANPNIPDTPQRIATDTSQKIGIRFGETLKAYRQDPTRNVTDLHFIPLTIAAWCRYLMAIDDKGNSFEPSPDPLYDELYEQVAAFKLGEVDPVKTHQKLQPILQNKAIFGSDLYELEIAERIEDYFTRMISKRGAVRATLQEVLAKYKK
ncbi:mannitol dehydrogenase family protein [Enterococcus sp. LJL99]